MDLAVFRAINSTHFPAVDPIMITVTWLGVGGGVWFALALAAMAQPRHRAAATRAILAVAITLGVNGQILKPLVGRQRPFVEHAAETRVIQEPRPTSASFPSGHAATAAAGAMSLARVWPSARLAPAVLAVLIAYSRVYVGVHYPTDVLAGLLLGAACAWFVLAGRHPSTRSRSGTPAPASRYVP